MGRDGGEASAKERRCQVKFALTEGERRASSCGRRRTHYEMRKEEGGLLKIFAAVNISRGEKKRFFCRYCLRILYTYAHTQLTPSSRLCILMISPPSSCMEISLSHPSLRFLPDLLKNSAAIYRRLGIERNACLYIDSTSTTHQTNLSVQQSKSQNWRIRLFFSPFALGGEKIQLTHISFLHQTFAHATHFLLRI